MTIDFDGRVAVVTGAGGGLGRTHALLLASRGARVVVNDLGVDPDGTGARSDMADAVVQEVVEAGGEAIPNPASVADPVGAKGIVDDALEAFGRIDIVVNNAGILRDRSFAKMEIADVQAVFDVHLLGAFNVTLAAWPHLREQGYGRVVNTTSPAGLYGNFGQSNYAAAKAGLVGFTRTLALEGAKYGINANVVSPLAASRMTEEILPPEVLALLDPAHVSAVVGYLASEACTETGAIFTAGGGYVARVGIVEGEGVAFDHVATPEEIAERWEDIIRLGEGTEYTRGAAEQGDRIVTLLNKETESR
jgi:NAD(P)-dependent dehydrogenase (short-subunit alcohol dehydrogenase family)